MPAAVQARSDATNKASIPGSSSKHSKSEGHDGGPRTSPNGDTSKEAPSDADAEPLSNLDSGPVIEQQIALDAIRIDEGLQVRCDCDKHAIRDLVTAIEDNETIPPIDVFRDGDQDDGYWLADGHHRFIAMYKAGVASTSARIHPGGRHAALLYAIEANREHRCTRLTREDKRRAVKLLLEDPACADWSNRVIADTAGVSPSTVAKARKVLDITQPEVVVGKDGNQKKVGKIGRSKGHRRSADQRIDLLAEVLDQLEHLPNDVLRSKHVDLASTLASRLQALLEKWSAYDLSEQESDEKDESPQDGDEPESESECEPDTDTSDDESATP